MGSRSVSNCNNSRANSSIVRRTYGFIFRGSRQSFNRLNTRDSGGNKVV